MLEAKQIHEIAQKLIDKLEKEVGATQHRIEGIALLYKLLAEADERSKDNIDSSKA